MVKVFRFSNVKRGRKKGESSDSLEDYSPSEGQSIDSSTADSTHSAVTLSSNLPSSDNNNYEELSLSPDETLTMVVYESSDAPSLPDSFQKWTRAVQALAASEEMKVLLTSSQEVLASAVVSSRDAAVNTAVATGSLCVHVVCLPVTLPLHVASSATHLVCGVTGNVMELALGSSSRGEHPSEQSPVEGLVHNVFNIVPFVADQAGRLTLEVGGAVGKLIAPVFGGSGHNQDESSSGPTSRPRFATCSGESSAERESFLDRLRLEIPMTVLEEEPISRATPSDVSKYLLRVDDVDVRLPPNPAASNHSHPKVMYIDLGKDFGDDDLTAEALGKLRRRALDMCCTRRLFGHSKHTNRDANIAWKPEGDTAKHMRTIAQLSNDEMYRNLHSTVLIWSGKWLGPKYYGSETALFLARGVVQRSPRQFLDLLWTSSRTSEYNAYNLGRSDTLIVEDDIRHGGDFGTKVVKSETKVPFTGLSVGLSTLMNASSLEDEEGFVVVSRSLNSGMAGCHVKNSGQVDPCGKNEVILGVNIMRPVPGKPHLTDLTSLSQVKSSMVPQFLTTRIGILGVQDFFKNVR
eukprot:scaffold2462_cov127-Cylindrotheca_fusiformis.AAC.11